MILSLINKFNEIFSNLRTLFSGFRNTCQWLIFVLSSLPMYFGRMGRIPVTYSFLPNKHPNEGGVHNNQPQCISFLSRCLLLIKIPSSVRWNRYFSKNTYQIDLIFWVPFNVCFNVFFNDFIPCCSISRICRNLRIWDLSNRSVPGGDSKCRFCFVFWGWWIIWANFWKFEDLSWKWMNHSKVSCMFIIREFLDKIWFSSKSDFEYFFWCAWFFYSQKYKDTPSLFFV